MAAYTFLVSIDGADSEPMDLDFSDHEDVVRAARIHLQIVLAGQPDVGRACVRVDSRLGDRLSRFGLWSWSPQAGWLWWQAG